MRRRWSTAILASVALLLAACGEQASSPSPTGLAAPKAPASILNDGSRTGGNPDFFFLPPLVPDPSRLANYDAARFSPIWKPVVQVCRLGADPATGCQTPWLRTYTTEVMLSTADQQYQVNVDSKEAWATEGLYRIRVALVREDTLQLGFIDIGLMPNQQAVKNLRTQDVVGLQDGRTIPLKFRIEEGAAVTGASKDYKEQVVPNTGGTIRTVDQTSGQPGGAIVSFPSGWLGNQASEVVVTVEKVNNSSENPCTTRVGRLIQTSDCWRIRTFPDIATVQADVVVGFCPTISPLDPRYGAQTMYKYDADQEAALRELPGAVAPGGFTCPTATASITRPGVLGALQRSLAFVGDGLSKVFGPNTAYAIDAGWGGRIVSGSEAFSDFFWGIPLDIDKNGGDGQSAAPGATLPNAISVRVTGEHHHVNGGIPIKDVPVTFTATTGNGTVASTTVITDANGIASTTWTLGSAGGTQQVTASVNSVGETTTQTFTATAGRAAVFNAAGQDVSGTTQTITVGDVFRFSGGTVPNLNTPCTYTTNNPAVVNLVIFYGEFGGNGVQGVGAGSATLTVTCGTLSSTVNFTVAAPPATGSITLYYPSGENITGRTLSVSTGFATRIEITTSNVGGGCSTASSNTSVGTMVANDFKAIAPGTVVVTVTCGNYSASVTYLVSSPQY